MYTMSGSDALQEYQQIGTTNTVGESSPHHLIQLMMEHALSRINFARGHMERKEIASKGKNIGDAISVINGLQVSLNHKANKRMSENFDALYTYMMRRLLQANLNDDLAALDEVAGLLREVKEAWDAIADDPAVITSAVTEDN
jgi:flagellar secretion chaperone FliS